MTKKYIFGLGGHAKVVIDTLESNGIKIDGAFSDIKPINSLTDIAYIGRLKPNQLKENETLLIAIGNNKIRKEKTQLYRSNYFNAIHKSSILSNYIALGKGNVIFANSVINAGSKIGNHCIINTAAIIEHDNEIADYVHISPNATLCGNVIVGEGTHIGAGSVVTPGVKIGKWATIGASSVIIKDVPDYAIIVGNPGKVIKYNRNE